MSESKNAMAPDGEVAPYLTRYRAGQDNVVVNIGRLRVDIHHKVFMISGAVVIAFVIVTLAFLNEISPLFKALLSTLTSRLDWFFLAAGNIFVLLCLGLICSPLGKVRIGGTLARPDYNYVTWFSMLFAAGMGIGLMFYGVSEPLSHFSSSMGGVQMENGARSDWAPLSGAANAPESALRLAMAATIFHWALHPWAIYAVLALGLALFTYNKGLPLTIRSVFYPLLGERVWGWPRHLIDILAVLATIFGLATSLGLGASQTASGLNFLFNIPMGQTTQILLVVVITALATLSVVAGLDVGVRRLSELNMILAGLLLLFIVVVGPSLILFSGFFSNLVAYFEYRPALSNPVQRADSHFVGGWTSFYWAWWISWSPFVGMFIARISRGRTVREFIISVLLVPSLACVIWMTIMGETAIHQYFAEGFQSIAAAKLPLQLFTMLNTLPLAKITCTLAIVLVVIFFVTSADSGTLVVDIIASGGKVDCPNAQRVFWCAFEGVIAVVLIMGGGVEALQAMVVSTGLPFTIVLLVACAALVKGLASEPRLKRSLAG